MNTFRIIVSIVCLLAIYSLSSNPLTDALKVDTISSTRTDVTFQMPDFRFTDLVLKDRHFHSIEIEDGLPSADTGLPEVPHYAAAIAVPIGSTINLSNVKLSEPRYIRNINLAPVQNYDNPEYVFDIDEGFYQSKDVMQVYPKQTYFVTDIATIRDYQFVILKVNPVKYYPATQTLEVYDNITLTVEHEHYSTNPRYNLNAKISREFETNYEHLLANYSQIRIPNPIYQEPSLLIIYGGSPSQTIINNYVAW